MKLIVFDTIDWINIMSNQWMENIYDAKYIGDAYTDCMFANYTVILSKWLYDDAMNDKIVWWLPEFIISILLCNVCLQKHTIYIVFVGRNSSFANSTKLTAPKLIYNISLIV